MKGATHMFYAGDKPGKGTYICTECKHRIIIEDDNDKLPICPFCQCAEWKKVESPTQS